MEKSNDIKASDLLERVRKNLRQQEGEPEPEVLTEEFILNQNREAKTSQSSNIERGELIKELFGTKDGDDEADGYQYRNVFDMLYHAFTPPMTLRAVSFSI